MRTYILGFVFGLIALVGFSLVGAGEVHAGTTPVTGWAWSSNIGWISFNSTNPCVISGVPCPPGATYSVTVSTTSPTSLGAFAGYAWSPNIGWISLNAADVAGCPTGYDGTTAALNGCNPTVNLTSGAITGWARILSIRDEDGDTLGDEGWLHLSGANHDTLTGQGVKVAPSTGNITGYAWEPSSVGWVVFIAKIGTGATTPPPVTITGNCSLVGGSPQVIQTGQSVGFTTSGVGGGVAPYTYEWNTGIGSVGPNAAPNLTHPYPAAGGPHLTGVTIRDNNGAESYKTCGSVTVNDPVTSDILQLRIGRTIATANKISIGIREGARFALKWDNTLAADYSSCATSITNGGETHWSTYWDDETVQEGPGDRSGSVGSIPTAGVPRGTYEFTLTCTDTVAPLGPVRSDTATLRIVTASEEEF